MGNNIDQNKDSIIWIDTNIFNDENKKTYELQHFSFDCFFKIYF